MYLADIYTVSANLAGIPALTIPYGKTEIRNEKLEIRKLPIGLQIMGKHFDEKTILRVGNAIELEARD
jgi:aspartyl-tRNA(Asn)/glutamyl-tRNA(Gln) amidotransferase subunit A